MNRTSVLTSVARILDARSYLEIGVFDPRHNFDHIPCPDKLGIDPAVDDPRIARTTSDDFFGRLAPNRCWDLIFIDGDHRYERVERDLANALRHLSPHGVVAMHDVDPADTRSASPTKPSPSAIWSGEAWRVLVERVRARSDLRSATVDCDHGVALITRGHNPSPLTVESPLSFAWLETCRERALNLIPAQERAIREFLGRASIVYYTSNQAKPSIRQACFQRLRQSAAGKELVVIAQQDEAFFASADQLEVVGRLPFCHQSLYLQLLNGIQRARYDTAFMAEDDVLYPDGYFDAQLPDRYRFFYNTHSYVANLEGFFATKVVLTSNGFGDRELLSHAVRQRLRFLRAGGTITWTEPGVGDHDDFSAKTYRQKTPTVDIRHQQNLTGYRAHGTYLDRIEPWGSHRELLERLGLVEVTPA
ncbi:MAG: class I SAM-dependent methyltransferase [Acidobacteriota bacterium]